MILPIILVLIIPIDDILVKFADIERWTIGVGDKERFETDT
jgi:hypothetical protein